MNMLKTFFLLLLILCLGACSSQKKTDTDANSEISISDTGKLQVSENGRFFQTENGDPFFWLGDTGWLLFAKLNREEADQYLENRSKKGFNVVQVMVLHSVSAENCYGDSALINQDVATPKVTEGNDPADSLQYDYWDHVDYIVDKAAEKGIYIGMVPVWGSNVKAGFVEEQNAKTYATWLANRYKNRPNIIWLNGGDTKGEDSTKVWQTLGATLNQEDKNHLITFHPFGRTQSSKWFHRAGWLDFNMFQSGHRRYDQDTTELAYGEDNWRYIQADYRKTPAKPTLDGEPSYEGIPQGLHDPKEPYWTDKDVRRYAYWSVFAGGCGFTYGSNAVMQMHGKNDGEGAYGVRKTWQQAIDDPGAGQMIYLKQLMLSKPYFDRVPDQTLIASKVGDKHDYLVATRGSNYAFVYTYTGSNIQVNMGKISGKQVLASWYNPRDGSSTEIGEFENQGIAKFDPPGDPEEGNDWVLVLNSKQ